MPAAMPTSSTQMTATDRCQAKVISPTDDAGQHDRQTEPAPPRQGTDQPWAGRDADRETDEDHREQDVERRLAAAERPGVELGAADDHAAAGERGEDAEHQAAHRAASCRRTPSRRRTRAARRAGVCDRSLRPLISLMPKKTTRGRGEPGEREEVQRERGRVEEALAGALVDPGQPLGEAGEQQRGRDRGDAVRRGEGELVGRLEPAPGQQVGHRRVLGRQPGHRDRLDQEGGDRGPGDDLRCVRQ